MARSTFFAWLNLQMDRGFPDGCAKSFSMYTDGEDGKRGTNTYAIGSTREDEQYNLINQNWFQIIWLKHSTALKRVFGSQKHF